MRRSGERKREKKIVLYSLPTSLLFTVFQRGIFLEVSTMRHFHFLTLKWAVLHRETRVLSVYRKCLWEHQHSALAARQRGNGNEADTLLPVAVRVFKAGVVLHLWQDVRYLVLRITQDAFKHCSKCCTELCGVVVKVCASYRKTLTVTPGYAGPVNGTVIWYCMKFA